MTAAHTPETHRPLRPAVFHILLALADGDRHGYAIKKEVEERTSGAVRMGPGTLYESIQRMEESDLIEESDRRPGPADDKAQRRYYRLTPHGEAMLRAEVTRLADVLDYAKTKPILRDLGHA